MTRPSSTTVVATFATTKVFCLGGKMRIAIWPFEGSRLRLLAAILFVVVVAIVGPVSRRESLPARPSQQNGYFVYVGT